MEISFYGAEGIPKDESGMLKNFRDTSGWSLGQTDEGDSFMGSSMFFSILKLYKKGVMG